MMSKAERQTGIKTTAACSTRVEGCLHSQGPGSEASLAPKSGVSKCEHNPYSHPGLVGSGSVGEPNKEVGDWTSCAAAPSITQLSLTILVETRTSDGATLGRPLRAAPIPQPANTPNARSPNAPPLQLSQVLTFTK